MKKYFYILASTFIFLATTLSYAARPFVTEDASTPDQFQLDASLWLKAQSSSSDTTVSQFLFLGLGVTDWLQISGTSGRGYDFDNEEQTLSNPSLQTKIAIWNKSDQSLLALVSGLNLRNGKGQGLHEDANSYYILLSLQQTLINEWVYFNINLGRRFINERYKNTYNHTYWGFKIDTKLPMEHLRFSLEAYRGDLFQAVVPHISYQAGFSYLLSEMIQFDLLVGTQREINSQGIKTRKYETWGIFGVRILFDIFK